MYLVEVVRPLKFLIERDAVGTGDQAALVDWFEDYLEWLRISPNGLDESDGTNYALQVAAFADLIKAPAQLD